MPIASWWTDPPLLIVHSCNVATPLVSGSCFPINTSSFIQKLDSLDLQDTYCCMSMLHNRNP